MSVTLRTITGGILTAAEHAMMNFGAFPHDGFLNPTVNIKIEGSSIHFNDDIYGLIAGRMFRITDETFSFVLPISGTLAGTIYLKLDLDNIDNPLQLISTTTTPPEETTFESGVANFDNSVVIKYICTFNVTPTAITDLDVVYPVNIWGEVVGDQLVDVPASKIDGIIDSGNLPTVPVSKGGTGATTAANARTNLGAAETNSSTKGAIVQSGSSGQAFWIQANAGANSAYAGKRLYLIISDKSIGLYNATDNVAIWTHSSPISISQGGTGQTTAAAARNALGLGNTTGALPVANGGTGATSAANARTNLGVKCTKLWEGALSTANSTITFTFGGYNAYIIMGTCNGTTWEENFIPAGDWRNAYGERVMSDEAQYVWYKTKYSGTTGTILLYKKSNTNGKITSVWGLN